MKKTRNYYKFQNKNKKEFDKFISENVFFAFSDDQFKNGLKKFNIKEEEIKDKLIRYYGGGFMLKTAREQEKQIWNKINKHNRKYLSNFKNLINAFEYEMGNHECAYTGRYTDSLEPLGFSKKDLKNKRIAKAFVIARRKAYKTFCKYN